MTSRGRSPRSAIRGGGKRKPGKQRGAPGAHLEWNEYPADKAPCFPEGACGCGASLEDARDLGVRYSHQVTDLPGAKAETTQYDRHAVECACGTVHVADAPGSAGQPGTVTYGLNFQAWCVFLMVMHHVPVERCADILESMSGVRPSDGWVHALLARAARAVAAANRAIRALIILARVICGDETPVRAGPGPKSAKKKYLHVACTNLLTYYFLGDRDLPSFRAFIYSDLHGTVIVHDRYQNYDHFDGVAHQLCCAHLLRDLEAAAQDYPGAAWPGQVARELRALIHAANIARDQGLASVPDEQTAEHLRLFRHGVAVGLSAVPRVPGPKSKQPPARCLLECLRDREADVLRFLTERVSGKRWNCRRWWPRGALSPAATDATTRRAVKHRTVPSPTPRSRRRTIWLHTAPPGCVLQCRGFRGGQVVLLEFCSVLRVALTFFGSGPPRSGW